MKRYLMRFRGSENTLVVLLLLAVVNGVIPGLAVVLVQRALDGLSSRAAPTGPLLGLVGIAVVTPALQLGRARLSRKLAWDLVHRLRMDVHAALHRVVDRGPAGDRIAALSHECDELQYGLSALITAARSPLTVVVLLATASWLAPGLVLRLVGVVPLVGVVAWLGGRWVRDTTRVWREARSTLLVELIDQHNGIATTLDHGAVEAQLRRAQELSRAEADARAQLEWVKGAPTAILQSVLILVVAGLLWSATDDVAAGRASVGGLVGFVVAMGLVRDPVAKTTEIYTLMTRSLTALDRVLLVVEQPESRRVVAKGEWRLNTPGVLGRLGAVTIRIEPNAKVAIVGSSGAGKSTLLHMLHGDIPGLESGEGSVLCRQDPWIFNRTLRENLDLSGRLSDGQLHAVLARLDLRDRFSDLDLPLGEQGSRLSGGERQRVALARAICCPAALLLDEATSEVEPARSKALATWLSTLDRTVLFATHEPWFCERADRVLWLEEGALRGDATHAELLLEPAYQALWGNG